RYHTASVRTIARITKRKRPVTLSTPEIFLNFLPTMSHTPNSANDMMQDVLPSSIEAIQTDVEYDAPSSTPPLKRVKTTVTSTKTTPL
ncbi:20130_t:CDS:1, partial [Gigaspora rosea]